MHAVTQNLVIALHIKYKLLATIELWYIQIFNIIEYLWYLIGESVHAYNNCLHV